MESVIVQETLVDSETSTTKVEKKVKSASKKKTKKVYESVRVMDCDRCVQSTVHTLFNYDTKAYKCNICGTIHIKRN